jgi:hypothetical protein
MPMHTISIERKNALQKRLQTINDDFCDFSYFIWLVFGRSGGFEYKAKSYLLRRVQGVYYLQQYVSQ